MASTGQAKKRWMQPGKWFWLPKSILERGLSRRAINTYVALAYYSNGRTQKAFPSQRTLAKRLGASRETVHRAIKELETAGFVSKGYRRGNSCNYKLLDPTQSAVATTSVGALAATGGTVPASGAVKSGVMSVPKPFIKNGTTNPNHMQASGLSPQGAAPRLKQASTGQNITSGPPVTQPFAPAATSRGSLPAQPVNGQRLPLLKPIAWIKAADLHHGMTQLVLRFLQTPDQGVERDGKLWLLAFVEGVVKFCEQEWNWIPAEVPFPVKGTYLLPLDPEQQDEIKAFYAEANADAIAKAQWYLMKSGDKELTITVTSSEPFEYSERIPTRDEIGRMLPPGIGRKDGQASADP